MLIFKKLIFALPFILFLTAFFLELQPFLKDPYLILSLEMDIVFQIIPLLIFLLLANLSFVIFATLASDWRFILPVCLLASLTPLVFIPFPTSILFTSSSLLSFGLTYFLLERKLSSYFTFQPASLLLPSLKQLTTLLLLFSSFTFYISANSAIRQNGFKVPDSLIESSLKLIPGLSGGLESDQLDNPLSQIPPEQIELLKQNPDLLKQYGLNPSILDQINNPQTSSGSQAITREMIAQQVQNFIKPYVNYIPLILSLAFFFTLQSIASLLSLPLSALIWLVFRILEKTGFTQYQVETREVKKLVV